MTKICALLVVFGALLAQRSPAWAATQIRLPANNLSAAAIVTNPETGATTGIFVTRVIGEPGGPVDSFFFTISTPDGGFISGSGVLPRGAFQVTAQSASLDVDLNAVPIQNPVGEIPADGVISIDWTATEAQHTAGGTRIDLDNGQVLFVGTRTDASAEVDGTVFGAPLVGDDTNSRISVLHSAIIIITQS